jgi:uncharacterized membrane protein YcgQ (UPF0703/DUF1980 family)
MENDTQNQEIPRSKTSIKQIKLADKNYAETVKDITNEIGKKVSLKIHHLKIT